MKVPVSWLEEYVDLGLSAEELSDRLTFSGVEVEGIEQIGSDYAGLIVGEVRDFGQHPNADRLRLCRVFDGQEELQVVCGASNFEVGDKVAFAPVGAVLPDGMKLRKAKIRGEKSFGMMCASDELGLGSDHSGILLLDREAPAGTPLGELLPGPETVLTLEITWNRPDCLSMIGIAREFAALLGRPLRWPSVDYAETDVRVEDKVRVIVDDAESCPRYTARWMTGVQSVPSPAWMQRRLELCGVRPINCAVDVTNYVMLECGQPLHAFDYGLLKNGTIVVRRAHDHEVMDTLDGIERTLTPEMLVIADETAPVAVAGVMGGAGSEIQDTTETVLLESATFAAPRVKHTATALAIRTESSHRFERGVDPGLAEWASRRASALLAQYAGACVARGVVDCDARDPEPHVITMRYDRVRAVMGVALSTDKMIGILESLELEVKERGDDACCLRIPSHRLDLILEADLIEEVARIHGLEGVPESLPVAQIAIGADDSRTAAVSRCRHILCGLGISEALNYSFVSANLLDAVEPDAGQGRLVLPNPVSADYAILRDSLLPQMIDTLGRNHTHGVDAVSLFEMGRVFGVGADGQGIERECLAIGQMGPVGRGPQDRRRPVQPEEAVLWLKGVLSSLVDATHAGRLELVQDDVHAALAPGWGAHVELDGIRIGVMGRVNDALCHRWRVTQPMVIAELALEPLLARVFVQDALVPVPSYPSITRDMALVAESGVTHAQIVEIMRREGPAELTQVQLFDIFKKKGMGSKQRSLAYSLEYRAADRTLTDEEVNSFDEAIREALRRDLKVEIREN